MQLYGYIFQLYQLKLYNTEDFWKNGIMLPFYVMSYEHLYQYIIEPRGWTFSHWLMLKRAH